MSCSMFISLLGSVGAPHLDALASTIHRIAHPYKQFRALVGRFVLPQKHRFKRGLDLDRGTKDWIVQHDGTERYYGLHIATA